MNFHQKQKLIKQLGGIEQVRDEILQNTTNNNTYQNIKIVHDYLVDNLQYIWCNGK